MRLKNKSKSAYIIICFWKLLTLLQMVTLVMCMLFPVKIVVVCTLNLELAVLCLLGLVESISLQTWISCTTLRLDALSSFTCLLLMPFARAKCHVNIFLQDLNYNFLKYYKQ